MWGPVGTRGCERAPSIRSRRTCSSSSMSRSLRMIKTAGLNLGGEGSVCPICLVCLRCDFCVGRGRSDSACVL